VAFYILSKEKSKIIAIRRSQNIFKYLAVLLILSTGSFYGVFKTFTNYSEDRSILVESFVPNTHFGGNAIRRPGTGGLEMDANQNGNGVRLKDDLLPQRSLPSPSPGVDYRLNPTVFGEILRGEQPQSKIYLESAHLLAFRDIRPRAPLHALVIPKRYIPTIQNLDDDAMSKDLLLQMQDMAHNLLQKHLTSDQYEQKDYILCFHIPPFNSVDHLHLHVLAPASEMKNPFIKHIKYHTHTRWCIGLDEVLGRIQQGQPVTPYSKDDGWWTILCQVFQARP
jgi:diadenosine tetraphosphate (Ap4A) HIT family hydrolase